MKKVVMNYKQISQISQSDMKSAFSDLKSEITTITNALQKNVYGSDYASLGASRDKKNVHVIQTAIEDKKALNPTILVVIGIGGSNLGTIAVMDAVKGLLYNDQNPSLKIYFADTVDSDMLSTQLTLVEKELKQGNNILINVVTKSGSTTETISNFELFLNLLKRYKQNDYHDYVVITTDANSKLAVYGRREKMTVLPIPEKVGGRYSVFTAVGLFPLGMLGVNIERLLQGASDSIDGCLSQTLDDNPAAVNAIVKYLHSKRGVNICDLFIFSKDLMSLGLWYRQLMGESIGKEANGKGVGMTPTVSVGSTDLHSVGQLYLGGPRDKLMTFIEVGKNKTSLSIPKFAPFEQFVAKIQGKSVSLIMDAIVQGVQSAYQKHQRPYMTLIIPEKTEYWIGFVLQMYMIEMMYLGFLFGVNPFNQPHVELYKKETREILSRE